MIFNYRNRYAEALTNYEKGVDRTALTQIQLSDTALDEHKRMCEFGIARTNIKLGNYKKGVGQHIDFVLIQCGKKKTKIIFPFS